MIASVYCLVGEDDKILYCGQSRNVRLRMAQHANSPRKARLNYAKIAVWTPQLVSSHQRLVLESIITALAIPPGNSVVALRRTKWGVWTEITSLRWAEYKGK
jgi:excinuclease UvrABC nuclease subunit